jgi:hypothetical protein
MQMPINSTCTSLRRLSTQLGLSQYSEHMWQTKKRSDFNLDLLVSVFFSPCSSKCSLSPNQVAQPFYYLAGWKSSSTKWTRFIKYSSIIFLNSSLILGAAETIHLFKYQAWGLVLIFARYRIMQRPDEGASAQGKDPNWNGTFLLGGLDYSGNSAAVQWCWRVAEGFDARSLCNRMLCCLVFATILWISRGIPMSGCGIRSPFLTSTPEHTCITRLSSSISPLLLSTFLSSLSPIRYASL